LFVDCYSESSRIESGIKIERRCSFEKGKISKFKQLSLVPVGTFGSFIPVTFTSGH